MEKVSLAKSFVLELKVEKFNRIELEDLRAVFDKSMTIGKTGLNTPGTHKIGLGGGTGTS